MESHPSPSPVLASQVVMFGAAPIDQRLRTEFLTAVAAELEANGQAGAVGIGSVHRTARAVQRRFFDPPQISPNATAPVRRGRAA